MISQPPKQKGFFAKYWGLLLAGGLVIGFMLLAALGVGAYFLLRSNVQANSIVFSMEKPELGKPLTAKVELENKGILDADYHAVLLVDGEEAAIDDVKLTSKDPQTLSFELKGLPAGKHTASIAGVEEEFTVYRPAELKVTGFTVEPESVMMGEVVKVKATVKNSGELPGGFEAPLAFDGAELQVLKATVEPGEETVIEAEFILDGRGQHTFALEGENRTVTALAPAQIEVAGLKLSKVYPKPKEAVTATVTVQNSGDLPGEYTVVLSVNGKAAQKKEVTVEANSTLDVAFKVAQSKTGRYSIQCEEYTQSMRVVVITRPANGAYLVRKIKNGPNQMTIVNNFSQDVIITLTKTSSTKVAQITIYLRAKGKFTIKGVADGDYRLFYSVGKNYDSASKQFITDVAYQRSDSSYKFTSPGYRYTIWTVTLNAASGNTTNSDVNASDFPK